ncbi:MAG: UDP-N-acetylmuramoyl-tripeptide--D-alanyl-D-alanine ligase [Pseudomonadota bacterium]
MEFNSSNPEELSPLNVTLEWVLQATGGSLAWPIKQAHIFDKLSTDSRAISAQNLFLALKGERFDGHNFIEAVFAQGASGVIASAQTFAHQKNQQVYLENKFSHQALILVPDTLKALQHLARAWRKEFSTPFIAVTGSCGKTSVKELLARLLSEIGPTLASQANFNNEIGAPQNILRLRSHHKFGVAELGANHIGEIADTVKCVMPHVSIITTIRPAHLEGFGSVAGVITAKSEIMSELQDGGVMVLNRDDEAFPQLKNNWQTYHQKITAQSKYGLRLITFGQHTQADVRLLSVQSGMYQTHIEIEVPTVDALLNPALNATPTKKLIYRWSWELLGNHHALNACAALAALLGLNLNIEQFVAHLSQHRPVKGRMYPHKVSENLVVVDDTYNANPGSVEEAMLWLSSVDANTLFILGDMAELGEDSDKWHAQVGQLAKQKGIKALWSCGTLSAVTSEAFGPNAKHFIDKKSLIEALQNSHWLQHSPNAHVIVVKGSRSAGMEMVVNALIR